MIITLSCFLCKEFPHTKVLPNLYGSLKKRISCPHDFSPLSFAVHSNPRASGAPEASYDQIQVKAAMLFQINSSTNRGKQFSTMTLQGQSALPFTLDTVKTVLMSTPDTATAKFLQRKTVSLSIGT